MKRVLAIWTNPILAIVAACSSETDPLTSKDTIDCFRAKAGARATFQQIMDSGNDDDGSSATNLATLDREMYAYIDLLKVKETTSAGEFSVTEFVDEHLFDESITTDDVVLQALDGLLCELPTE